MDNWYYLRGIDITPEKVNTTPHMLFERKNVYRIIIFYVISNIGQKKLCQ